MRTHLRKHKGKLPPKLEGRGISGTGMTVGKDSEAGSDKSEGELEQN
jgi:hypothetical protein